MTVRIICLSSILIALIRSIKSDAFDFSFCSISDFGPKKIVDAINIPQHDLTNKYDTSSIVDLIEKKAKDIENIVFHCMYSQVRGPTSAKYYHRFRKNNYPKYHKQNVFILQGGYRWFLQQNPHYCENI